MLYLIAEETIRKTIKVKKVLRVKWVLAAGIVKEIVMAYNKRRFLVKHGYHHCSRWPKDPEHIKLK